MSINHNFIELGDSVYSRYIKTITGVLSGMRPDPYDIRKRIPYLLKTPETLIRWQKETVEDHTTIAGIESREPINYEEEVLEIYSAEQDKVFRQLNKIYFENGSLIPYHEEKTETISMVNALSDTEILEIANSANLLAFKKKIKPITSTHTLDRIDAKLTELGRKPSFKQALAEHKDSHVT